jgi:autotransporter-associated beta strand protein
MKKFPFTPSRFLPEIPFAVHMFAVICIASVITFPQASAQSLYWSPGANPDAGGAGTWSTAGDWSTTSGSTKTASSSAPTASNDVVFGGTAGNVDFNVNPAIGNNITINTSGYVFRATIGTTRELIFNAFVQTDELKDTIFTHARASSAATMILSPSGNSAFNGTFIDNIPNNHALNLTFNGTGRLNLTEATFDNTGSTIISNGTIMVRPGSTGTGVLPGSAIQIGIATANTNAVLEIDGGGSSSSFTRGIGNAAGEVRLGSGIASLVNNGAGFSAVNGDLTVNLGGSNATFSWTNNVGNVRFDTLILGADSATHRTIFANPISVGDTLLKTVRVGNGSASIDAQITHSIEMNGADRILRKDGAGTLLLSGTSASFGGRLNVEEGTLLVSGAITSATNNTTYGVNVATGATLGGTGSITLSNSAASTIINGSIAPGNSIGMLTINSNVTWNYNTDNEWVFELGAPGGSILSPGTSDRLAIGGNFLKGTGSNFIFDFANTGGAGWYQLISWTGTGSSFDVSDFVATNLGGSLLGTFSLESDGLYLSVIPEPSSALLIVMGLGAVLLRRKCRS